MDKGSAVCVCVYVCVSGLECVLESCRCGCRCLCGYVLDVVVCISPFVWLWSRYLSGEDPFLGYTLVQPTIQGIQSQVLKLAPPPPTQ